MPEYRRRHLSGGRYFFTQVTLGRADILCGDVARPILHAALADTRRDRPFDLEAVVLLPDHFHVLLRLSPGDDDYATRMAAVKARFTRAWRLAGGAEAGRSASRVRRGERGVWQRRFWEHSIRDVDDRQNHLDYVHWNPVKHGYVTCPHLWPWSTFHRWVTAGVYPADWRCVCDGRSPDPPDFTMLDETAME